MPRCGCLAKRQKPKEKKKANNNWLKSEAMSKQWSTHSCVAVAVAKANVKWNGNFGWAWTSALYAQHTNGMFNILFAWQHNFRLNNNALSSTFSLDFTLIFHGFHCDQLSQSIGTIQNAGITMQGVKKTKHTNWWCVSIKTHQIKGHVN